MTGEMTPPPAATGRPGTVTGEGLDIPFSDELVSRLIRHLSTLQEGERLPSERSLSDALGVSRTALRDRLMRLEAIGVLERRAGSGTYLRGMSSRMASDTLAMGMVVNNLQPGSMLPVRVALEREAARQAALRTDHLNLARMAVALDGMNVGVDDHAFREADYRFHSALIAASGVPSLEFFADILRDILSATIREVPLVERVEQLRPVHEAIYVAVRDRDPIGAMRAVDAHFEWLEQAAARGTFSQ
jgi:GntR family transcriptional repressor for pyruvate dehydrogenase complex